jgi:hypothetical protein
VNFERLKLPPSNPVAKGDWVEFAEVRDKAIALLPGTKEQSVAVSGATQGSPSRGTN